MGMYRKLPVVIEAVQFMGLSLEAYAVTGIDGALEFDEWIASKQGKNHCRYIGSKMLIPTLEGDMEASPGDWIICGVQGELYPIKPDIFAATYEAA